MLIFPLIVLNQLDRVYRLRRIRNSIFVPGYENAWDRPGGRHQGWNYLQNVDTGGRINMPTPGYYAFVEGAIGYATTQ